MFIQAVGTNFVQTQTESFFKKVGLEIVIFHDECTVANCATPSLLYMQAG